MEVVFLNASDHKAPCEFKPHRHSCYELILYTKGHGYVDIGDKREMYTENKIIVIPPDTLHNEINLLPAYNIFMGFHTDAACEIATGVYDSDARIFSILRAMLEELAGRREDYKKMLSFQLGQLLLLLRRTKLKSVSNTNFSYVINYINENLALPIKIEDLAKICNYSYDRFRHIFKEQIGMPPKEYIRMMRLKKAQELLQSEEKSITEIAYESGFYDASDFCKTYKAHCGLSPLQYRRQLQKGT